MRSRHSIHVIIVVLCFWSASIGSAVAQPRPEFEGEVIGEEVYAYSGPGAHFYPTNRLHQGEKVTVYGTPVGEYLQILPLKSRSFSWIPLEAVEEKATGAFIRSDDTPVYVGSELSAARWTWQVKLKAGAEVNVIDRVKRTNNGKLEEWYKVFPTEDEVRYVLASAIRAPDSGAQPIAAGEGRPAKDPETPVASRPAPVALRPAFGPNQPIPPAVPVKRSGLRKAAGKTQLQAKPVAFTDDRKLEFDQRARNFRDEMERMRTRLPDGWDLPGAEASIDDLSRSANKPDREKEIRRLRALLGQMEDRRRRYIELGDQWREFRRTDAALVEEQRRKEQQLSHFRPQTTAEGMLRSAKTLVGGQPAYSLIDARGATTHYVVAPAGLRIDGYLNRRVGLVGKVENRLGLPVPVLHVEQLSPEIETVERDGGKEMR